MFVVVFEEIDYSYTISYSEGFNFRENLNNIQLIVISFLSIILCRSNAICWRSWNTVLFELNWKKFIILNREEI